MIIRFVLIIKSVHARDMEGFVLLGFFLLLGPLAILFGANSRSRDERDQRGWWPFGERRDRAMSSIFPPAALKAPPARFPEMVKRSGTKRAGREAGRDYAAWAVRE